MHCGATEHVAGGAGWSGTRVMGVGGYGADPRGTPWYTSGYTTVGLTVGLQWLTVGLTVAHSGAYSGATVGYRVKTENTRKHPKTPENHQISRKIIKFLEKSSNFMKILEKSSKFIKIRNQKVSKSAHCRSGVWAKQT